jgi:hypothetical protein
MTAVRASTKGIKLQLANETALGTPGSYTDIEFNEATELPTQTRQAYKPPVGGRTNPADTSQVIDYEDGSGTGTLAIMARRGASTAEPTVGKMLRACGFSLAGASSLTTVDTGTSVSSLILAADNGTEDGTALAVQMDDGSFEPTLAAVWTELTTTVTPLYQLSADPTDGNAVQKMFTYTPRTGPITETSTVALKELSRAPDGSGNPQEFIHTGVAATLSDTTIAKNVPLEFSFDLMIADTAISDGSWSSETFNDRENLTLTDGSSFEFIMQSGDPSSGDLSRTTSCLLEDATISWGIELKQIRCVGGTNVNTIGGYVAEFTAAPKITVTGLFDAAQWAAFETPHTGGSGTNPETCLAFSWSGGNINYPSILIAFPRCRLAEAPSATLKGTDSGLVQGTLVFEATGANMNSNEGPTEPADQACYIAISGELS